MLPALTVAGSGASIWTAAVETNKVADAALAADRPFKQMFICDAIQNKSPELQTWCDHLPSTTGELSAQWAAVLAIHEIRTHAEVKP